MCNHVSLIKQLSDAPTNSAAASPTTNSNDCQSAGCKASDLSTEKQRTLLAALDTHNGLCVRCGDFAEDPVVSTCAHVYCWQCFAILAGGMGGQKGTKGVVSAEEFACEVCGSMLRWKDGVSANELRRTVGNDEGTTPQGREVAENQHP